MAPRLAAVHRPSGSHGPLAATIPCLADAHRPHAVDLEVIKKRTQLKFRLKVREPTKGFRTRLLDAMAVAFGPAWMDLGCISPRANEATRHVHCTPTPALALACEINSACSSGSNVSHRQPAT